MSEQDKAFFDRADAFIQLANSQMAEGTEAGQVSASFMYSLARYNAWFSAAGWQSGQDLAKVRGETIEMFVKEFQRLLEMNMDDYITNFDKYIPVARNNQP
ncbi:Protein of unknown function (DUF3144) [Methylophaga frappieri]|uniref:DUF3144 domain-containing protein n=1 Tax=Methylophaga frappieri (strain ATCC BAA-2434 / DSM 25690 / JAM7) TaxID=754477 RepID=I1YHW1_METFJ|nr:DUF3144 domain-containing protein [Methylophaga frappieri]AFJ02504.1 Protein of unknown function (DUF3144) [Methylophaga frappieri]